MRHISVAAFKEVIAAEKGNSTVDFINVCTPAEFKERHIEGVRNVPLDTIKTAAASFANKQTVYVHCRSGARAKKAIEELEALGVTADLVNVEGGLVAWSEAGFPTGSHTNRLPIMRQVFITAGALVVIGVVLSMIIHPSYVYLALFVGVGLIFAGVTGWCGMSHLLARMPWNK
jgi:rhodanese-related sulfurtransferase